MEIDKKIILEKLSEMNDEELKSIVAQIAKAAGIRQEKAEKAFGDMDRVKRGIASMSEKDLKSAFGLLDGDTALEIMKQMKDERGENG